MQKGQRKTMEAGEDNYGMIRHLSLLNLEAAYFRLVDADRVFEQALCSPYPGMCCLNKIKLLADKVKACNRCREHDRMCYV